MEVKAAFIEAHVPAEDEEIAKVLNGLRDRAGWLHIAAAQKIAGE